MNKRFNELIFLVVVLGIVWGVGCGKKDKVAIGDSGKNAKQSSIRVTVLNNESKKPIEGALVRFLAFKKRLRYHIGTLTTNEKGETVGNDNNNLLKGTDNNNPLKWKIITSAVGFISTSTIVYCTNDSPEKTLIINLLPNQ